jgi:hypothetical protein
MIWGTTLLLLGAEGVIIERGLLPMLSYREREGKGEKIYPL